MQDAHEFLNYLLNECSELLEKEAKSMKGHISSAKLPNGAYAPTNHSSPPPATWVHDLFQATTASAFFLHSQLTHSTTPPPLSRNLSARPVPGNHRFHFLPALTADSLPPPPRGGTEKLKDERLWLLQEVILDINSGIRSTLCDCLWEEGSVYQVQLN